jgi:hypothetical protein
VISADEDNHLACCHDELLRLATAGHGEVIRATLRRPARRNALGGPVPAQAGHA